MEPIKISGQYSFDDYKKTTELNREVLQWLKIIGKILDVVLFVLFAVASIYSILAGIWVGIPIFVILFSVLFFRYWYIPRRIRKVFSQEKYYQIPFEIEITEEYFSISNEISQLKLAWKDYVKWRENRDLILLYSSEASVRIIPKRLLNDENDGETIKRLLRENNVPLYQGPIGNALFSSAFYLLLILYILYSFYTVF